MTTTNELNPLEQYAPRYIIMDAPGCYGNYATVRGTYETLEQARRAHRGRSSLIVSTDGGWRATHQIGSQIHREFALKYEQL